MLLIFIVPLYLLLTIVLLCHRYTRGTSVSALLIGVTIICVFLWSTAGGVNEFSIMVEMALFMILVVPSLLVIGVLAVWEYVLRSREAREFDQENRHSRAVTQPIMRSDSLDDENPYKPPHCESKSVRPAERRRFSRSKLLYGVFCSIVSAFLVCPVGWVVFLDVRGASPVAASIVLVPSALAVAVVGILFSIKSARVAE